MRAIIVDDEPLGRRGVRQLLSEHPDVEIVGECRDGGEALRMIGERCPDVVFLDIEMPALDGMRLIRIQDTLRMPIIVFVTAHGEFAVQAFEAEAVDYLVKPLSRKRFELTMARVRRRFRQLNAEARLVVSAEGVDRLLEASDIDWIEAQDDYSVIHTGVLTYRVRQTLKALQGRLNSEMFVRVHRSTLVRLDRISELRLENADQGLLILRDGTELHVSRRRLAGLRARMRRPSLDDVSDAG